MIKSLQFSGDPLPIFQLKLDSKKESIEKYSNKIIELKEKCEEIKKEEIKKRHKEYWEQHVNEWNQAQEQIKILSEKIVELEKTISEIPGQAEIDDMRIRQQRMNNEKLALSIFKSKEKKEIQEKIDKLEKKILLTEMEVNIEKSKIYDKLIALAEEKEALEDELNKER